MKALEPSVQRIGIIGTGKAGLSMALAFFRAGHRILFWDESSAARQGAIAHLGSQGLVTPEVIVSEADWLLVALPDAQIGPWLDDLSLRLDWKRSFKGIMHLSGALGIEVLNRYSVQGGEGPLGRIALHPMRAFSQPALSADDLAETYFGVTADSDQTLALWKAWLPELSQRFVSIQESDRMLYHAAAVTASNFIVPLLVEARQLYAYAGVAESVSNHVIEGLVRSAMANFFTSEGASSLTGPIVRGDLETILGHLEALEPYPLKKAHYLNQALNTLAFARPIIGEASYQKIYDLLTASA